MEEIGSPSTWRKGGLHISPYTIRHILRRHGLTKRGPPCEAEAPLGRSLAWRVEALIRPSFSSKVRTPPVHRERPGEWPSKPGWA